MASLLSRFLGKKKNVDQSALLDGEKYEAVSKTTSPVLASFAEAARRVKSSKEKEHDKGKRFKRSSAGIYNTQRAESVPVLSLSLPEVNNDEDRKSQGLGVVFEGIADGPKTLDDEALGDKRLSPSETLVLVQKTSEVLAQRGLETLGVMRPHWFASPRQQGIQLKIIHRFLATLESQKEDAPSSSSSSAPPPTFEAELQYSDPHDVAAVLRWGLRHFRLEGKSFGSSPGEDWYRTFAERERSNSYPPKAFDAILVPVLPASHAELLRTTLETVSSLAAHSEENGISGNKLSKVLGWWIVSPRKIHGARWPEFYAQWEIAARQFEHLFLAYIRAQESRMPKRLTELVKNYPFEKNRHEADGIYLPRSRFSTRSADALFVQIRVDRAAGSRPHPLRIIEDAFKATAADETNDMYTAMWEEIRNVATKPAPQCDQCKEEGAEEAQPSLNLTSVLGDESIRLFSLVPTPDGEESPMLSLFTPLPSGRGRRSLSVGDQSPSSPTSNGRPQNTARESSPHNKAATSPPALPQLHSLTPDWQSFSDSGFHTSNGLGLAASLWDNETEVSQPPPPKKGIGAGKRSPKADSSRPRSAEHRPVTPSAAEPSKPARYTHSVPRLVKVDEAFIDFWADSLLDSIARKWPTFVVCQLKPLGTFKTTEAKPIEWLIIERVVEKPTLGPVTTSIDAKSPPPPPSPSKSDSFKANRWAASTLFATRKRFSFLTSPSKHDSAPAGRGGRKAEVEARVGEMGEILKEENEGVFPNGVKAAHAATDDAVNGTGNSGGAVATKVDVPPPPPARENGVSENEGSSAAAVVADTAKSSPPEPEPETTAVPPPPPPKNAPSSAQAPPAQGELAREGKEDVDRSMATEVEAAKAPQPVEEVQRPVEEVQPTAEETQRPVEETQKPAEEVQQPVEEPVEETQQPTEEVQQPAEETQQPAVETLQPTETQQPTELVREAASETREAPVAVQNVQESTSATTDPTSKTPSAAEKTAHLLPTEEVSGSQVEAAPLEDTSAEHDSAPPQESASSPASAPAQTSPITEVEVVIEHATKTTEIEEVIQEPTHVSTDTVSNEAQEPSAHYETATTTPQQPDHEPPSLEPYIANKTVDIPPADENDISLAKDESEKIESVDAQPEPAPATQEINDAKPEPTAEDAVDDGAIPQRQEAPEETSPEKESTELAP